MNLGRTGISVQGTKHVCVDPCSLTGFGVMVLSIVCISEFISACVRLFPSGETESSGGYFCFGIVWRERREDLMLERGNCPKMI